MHPFVSFPALATQEKNKCENQTTNKEMRRGGQDKLGSKWGSPSQSLVIGDSIQLIFRMQVHILQGMGHAFFQAQGQRGGLGRTFEALGTGTEITGP